MSFSPTTCDKNHLYLKKTKLPKSNANTNESASITGKNALNCGNETSNEMIPTKNPNQICGE